MVKRTGATGIGHVRHQVQVDSQPPGGRVSRPRPVQEKKPLAEDVMVAAETGGQQQEVLFTGALERAACNPGLRFHQAHCGLVNQAHRPPPLVVSEANLQQIATTYRSVDDFPDRTTFSSLKVLTDFLDQWRAAAASFEKSPFFQWRSCDGFSVARRFPLLGNQRNNSEPNTGLKRDQESRSLEIAGDVQQMLDQWRPLVRRSMTDLIQVKWQNQEEWSGDFTTWGDFLLYGCFARRSPFADMALSGAGHPPPSVLENDILGVDPCIACNDDGTLTLHIQSRRAVMVRRLEESLGGKSLKVMRAHRHIEVIFVELLRHVDTPRFKELREELLKSIEDTIDSMKNEPSERMRAVTAHILEEYEGYLTEFSNPALSDRDLLAAAFEKFKAPYFFTTPSADGFRDLRTSGESQSGHSGAKYEIDLALLPQEYKDRMFIAPDGEDHYYVEIDFPWGSLEDALTLAKSITRTEIKQGVTL